MKRRNDFGPGGADVPRAPTRPPISNQNQNILDAIRMATGTPNQANFGLEVEDRISPVIVVDPLSVPVNQLRGSTPANVAANAGFFSEIYFGINNSGGAWPTGAVLEVFITPLLVAGQGYNIIRNPSLSGFTNFTSVLYGDSRLGNPPVTTMVVGGTKNTAGASAGTAEGGLLLAPGAIAVRLGPYYLAVNQGAPTTDQGRFIMFRPAAVNLAASCIFDWRILLKTV